MIYVSALLTFLFVDYSIPIIDETRAEVHVDYIASIYMQLSLILTAE